MVKTGCETDGSICGTTPDCIDCITHLGSPPRPHCYQPFPAWPVTGLTNSLMMGISCNCYCLYTDTEYLERDNRWSRSSITIWHWRWRLSSWDIDMAIHNEITPSCVIVDCWCEIRGIISKFLSFFLIFDCSHLHLIHCMKLLYLHFPGAAGPPGDTVPVRWGHLTAISSSGVNSGQPDSAIILPSQSGNW